MIIMEKDNNEQIKEKEKPDITKETPSEVKKEIKTEEKKAPPTDVKSDKTEKPEEKEKPKEAETSPKVQERPRTPGGYTGQGGGGGGRPPQRTNFQRSGPSRYGSKQGGRFLKKKVCRFCIGQYEQISYKDITVLKKFISSDRSKILPRRITGTCAKHQRRLSNAIKRARTIALLPFV